MLETIYELEFEAVGGELADRLSENIDGKTHTTGALPFAVEPHVFCTVADDEFVVTVMKSDKTVARVRAPRFHQDLAMCQAVSNVFGSELPHELRELTAALADYGYRYIAKETGELRGHTETVLLMADNISELDAALSIDSEPDYLYDLLDGGADPLRNHISLDGCTMRHD
jgi:hypothetical protein